MIKNVFKGIWAFCSFLFVPQMGRNKRKHEMLKREVTNLISQERADGNLQELSAEYISKVLHADIDAVREVLREINA